MRLYTTELQEQAEQLFHTLTGLGSTELMEQASVGMVGPILQRYPEAGVEQSIRVFCGVGNNGGDGYALARHLKLLGRDSIIYEYKSEKPRRGAAASNREACVKLGIPICKLGEYRGEDGVQIDALFGSGFHFGRQLEEELIFCQDLRLSADSAPVIAIDLPSGIEGNTGRISGWTLPADLTLVPGYLKPAHAFGRSLAACGEIVQIPLLLPELSANPDSPYFMGPPANTMHFMPAYPEFRESLHDPAKTTHKARTGAVYVVAGAPEMGGAGVLSAESALYMGSRRVVAWLPQLAAQSALTREPSLIVRPRPEFRTREEAFEAMNELLRLYPEAPEGPHVVVLGPGLGVDEISLGFLEAALAFNGQLVLDASILRVLVKYEEILLPKLKLRTTGSNPYGLPIITPHPGEFAALEPDMTFVKLRGETETADEEEECDEDLLDEREFNRGIPPLLSRLALTAKHWNVALLYKDSTSILCYPGIETHKWPLCSDWEGECDEAAYLYLPGRHPSLGRAGSGDILAGAIAAFASFGADIPLAVGLAHHLAQLAAGVYEEAHGPYGFRAEDQLRLMREILNHDMEEED